MAIKDTHDINDMDQILNSSDDFHQNPINSSEMNSESLQAWR